MTKSSEQTAPEKTPTEPGAEPAGEARQMTRRGWTLVVSGSLFVVFVVLGLVVPVPFVAISPGPTYDTLGRDAAGNPVIQVTGHETFPTTGELRMTTVSLHDGVTLFQGLGFWASGRYALAPREEYFKPGETNEQVKQENIQQLQDSQTNAQVAALRKLGYPIKVLAKQIVSGSPADHVLSPGDRLITVNGKKIAEAADVRNALAGTLPGQTVQITFQSDGQPERTVPLTLASRPDRKEGFIGLTAVDRADAPFNVNISLQDVGGPSAGLMFTLAIIDRLQPGDLAGGRHIAGTGEITETGEVDPIGGISFKVVGAREAGATDFLVPEHNCAEAKSSAPDGLNLIKVSTLDDALAQLANLKAGRPTASC
ncbi:PDZ domain-containing protein [Amycolatopsis australiensis]|uniref:endopeptidase La n=1 Tax=Amycolatopsis australiensis TaxID=546364 RepID=A0A1K1T7N1_9PSEU|nr:S16 family serine protease [Amycolatopsis australiensis]SFW92359.1 PDZ domain-containing protein [Amycolatopsis australiensis]